MASRARRPTSEELLETLRSALTDRLPSTWSVEVRPTPPSTDLSAPDALLTVRAPDGNQATVPVEIQQKLDPNDVGRLVSQINSMMRPGDTERPLVVAPFLSPRTQSMLSENGLSYVTSGGTVRFVVGKPSVFIREKADEQDLWAVPREQPLRTLRGPIAGRVVRALCDFRPPYGVQELAQRSQTPIASVSRVLALLDTEALITRASRGTVTDVQWPDLIRRWTDDYAFSKANTVGTYLEPRGLPALLEKLKRTDLRYAVSGSIVAATLARVTVPRQITLYVDDLKKAATTLSLRPAERGANVVLAEPFNPVVFDRMHEVDGVWHAATSQVAADTLTGPGRSPAEGEALLQWMAGNEDAWRS